MLFTSKSRGKYILKHISWQKICPSRENTHHSELPAVNRIKFLRCTQKNVCMYHILRMHTGDRSDPVHSGEVRMILSGGPCPGPIPPPAHVPPLTSRRIRRAARQHSRSTSLLLAAGHGGRGHYTTQASPTILYFSVTSQSLYFQVMHYNSNT